MKYVLAALILSLSSNGLTKEPEEKEILRVFSRAKIEYKKYMKNEMQNRKQFEDFGENTFEPTVKKMVEEIDAGRCKSCLAPYLEASVYFSGSASEELWSNLKTLIKNHSPKISTACKLVKKDKIHKLKSNFEGSLDFLKAEGLSQQELDHLRVEIAPCLK
jgi:hypothetical protein